MPGLRNPRLGHGCADFSDLCDPASSTSQGARVVSEARPQGGGGRPVSARDHGPRQAWLRRPARPLVPQGPAPLSRLDAPGTKMPASSGFSCPKCWSASSRSRTLAPETTVTASAHCSRWRSSSGARGGGPLFGEQRTAGPALPRAHAVGPSGADPRVRSPADSSGDYLITGAPPD
jgi:hypothetical protein